MITAVDSSILLDWLLFDQRYGPAAREALREAERVGVLTASAPVWAEVRAHFSNDEEHAIVVGNLRVQCSGLDQRSAAQAGAMWRQYRAAGGPRSRVATDFLIGAHALCQADCLLTRDRGVYRAYFGSLRLVTPSID